MQNFMRLSYVKDNGKVFVNRCSLLCIMVSVLFGSFFFMAQTVMAQTYPDMMGIVAPEPGLLPFGADDFTPPVNTSTPSEEAPSFAEWTRQGKPDDNIIATGYNFTTFTGNQAGKDTRFLVYGRSATSGNVLMDGKILRLDSSDKLTITLDAGLPKKSMYLIWPKNSKGWGRPITVNQTIETWVGPNKATRGQTISVFGQNLSHDNDTIISWVYIKPAFGSGQWAKVTSVNPYKVDFTVPEGLANGSYQVWVHNGHGGQYGWSGPQSLTVEDAFTWSGDIINVKNAPYNAKGDGVTDDIKAIRAALKAAVSGSRVYFPQGTYLITSSFAINSGVNIYGDGMNSMKIFRKSVSNSVQTITFSGSNVKISDITIEGDTSGGYNYYDIFIDQRDATDTYYENCRISGRTAGNLIRMTNTNYQYWTNCEFISNQTYQNGGQYFFKGCTFKGAYSADGAFQCWGVSGICIENCKFQNEDFKKYEGVLVRIFVGNLAWGETRLMYFGDNNADKLGQIDDPNVDLNRGEQFMFEGGGAYYIGSPSSATATTITFDDVKAISDQSIIILNGKGIGQARQITGSSKIGNLLTISFTPALNVVPNTSSKVGVGKWFNNVVIYRNYQSGRDDILKRVTANCACQFYGGSYNNIVDNNTYNHMRGGVQFWSIAQDATGSQYFNLVKDNKYINVEQGLDKRFIGVIGDNVDITFSGTVLNYDGIGSWQ